MCTQLIYTMEVSWQFEAVPYLHLELVDYEMEENPLKKNGGPRPSKIDEAIREKIIAMNEKGASTREIESYLGISKSHVSRILRGES